VEGIEFESAFVRVLSKREFVITKSSSFRFVAHNIKRNSPLSVVFAESAPCRVVRRLLCNETDAVNIISAIAEKILLAEAVVA
jgi:hypothetical protein